MRKYLSVLALPLVMSIASCTTDIGANDYYASSANTVNVTKACTVVSLRPVTIKSNDNNAGTLFGAAAGGVAGSAIGGGKTVPILGAIGGALVGGIAGDAAQAELSKQTGYEYIVRLNNGSLQTVVQGNDVYIQPGRPCYIIYGRQARVIPAN